MGIFHPTPTAAPPPLKAESALDVLRDLREQNRLIIRELRSPPGTSTGVGCLVAAAVVLIILATLILFTANAPRTFTGMTITQPTSGLR